jgi:hypothetical protein
VGAGKSVALALEGDGGTAELADLAFDLEEEGGLSPLGPTPDQVAAALRPLLEALEAAGDQAAQVALLERLWRVDTPSATFVLTSIGSLHPDKRVAKAARKCAMKHQTHQANRQ